MATTTPPYVSFSAGELTPRLAARIDSDIYRNGCKKLENLLVWTHGGATKRMGTKYIAPAKEHDYPVRLFSFVYSFGNAYILEFGHEYIRFYTDGGQIWKDGYEVEVTTPYQGEDLDKIKFAQTADTMYIVHPDYHPMKLTRNDNDQWSIFQVEFVWGPFFDENTDSSLVMTPSAATGEITITQTLERIENGDFTTSSGWSFHPNANGGTAAIVAQHAELAGGAAPTDESYFQQDFDTDPGYTHTLEFDCGNYAVNVLIRDDDFSITHYNASSTVGSNTINFTPNTRTTNLRFYKKGDPLLVSTIDDVSVIKGDDAFNEQKIGAFYKFTGTVERENTISGDDQQTGWIQMNANETVILSLNGTWVGTIWLQRSYDDGDNWVDYEGYTGNASKSYTEYANNIIYRAYCKTGDWTSGSADVQLSKLEQSGYAECTGYVSPTVIDALVVEPLPEVTVSGVAQEGGTVRWSEGAWSEHRGFPGTIAFFEGRLLFGGTLYRPQTIWGSVNDDYENFEAGVLANAAYTYTLVSKSVNDFQWMLDARILHIGTVSGEWKFGLLDSPTTPTNVSTSMETSYGSEPVQAIRVAHSTLFIQKGGTKLRKIIYDDNLKGWKCVDVSVVAEHLFKDGIVDMAYADNPDSVIWMVTGAGDIVTCVYDEDMGITAYQKQTTVGEFESVAVIPGDDRDEVWVVVRRLINGSYVRYIEQFQSTLWDNTYSYSIPDTPLEPIFYPPGGTYYADQTVTLVAPTGNCDIFYTLDGSDPIPETGTLYTEPILIEVTTQLKARAYLRSS